ALENALLKFESSDVKAYVLGFFTSFNDGDMLNFIETNGDTSTKRLIRSIRDGRICNAIARFTHKNLNPRTRMALSTIAKNGVAKKNFEDELSKRIADKHGMSVLVDLDIASGIPRSTRVRIGDDESFFYDESALANGLVRAISRQISLCVFGRSTGLSEASSDLLAGIESLSPDLLRFIRNENYLPVEGLLLIFFSAHRMFSREEDGRLVMPRLRNIAKIYQLVRELGAKERLSNLFDYKFHSRYGLPYSDRLFEDIQILVAMGMVDEDLRYFEKNGRWKQRYEYVLTSDGLGYAEMIAHSYQNELKIIDNHLMMNKHSIPRDMVSITSGRYGKGMKDRSHQHGK
ncbi:MAG TPA: HD domain-containing protein, partial [Candidatus Methanoperedens sp.]